MKTNNIKKKKGGGYAEPYGGVNWKTNTCQEPLLAENFREQDTSTQNSGTDLSKTRFRTRQVWHL